MPLDGRQDEWKRKEDGERERNMEWEKGKGVELKIEKDINNSKPNRELLPGVNVPHYLELYL